MTAPNSNIGKSFSTKKRFDPETGWNRNPNAEKSPTSTSLYTDYSIITGTAIRTMRLSNKTSSLCRIVLKAVPLFACCRLVPLIAASATDGSKKCERLQDALTYTQEEAPRDLSSVVSFVLNFRRLAFIPLTVILWLFLFLPVNVGSITSFNVQCPTWTFILNLIPCPCIASGGGGKN